MAKSTKKRSPMFESLPSTHLLLVHAAVNQITSVAGRFDITLNDVAKAVMLNQDNCCYLLQTIMNSYTIGDFIDLLLRCIDSSLLNKSSSLSSAAIC